jgi:hypothetical protein
MLDFTTLFIIAGLALGVLAGNAAIYGDTVRVQIDVAQSLSNAGFTGASAETVFMAQASHIVRGESIIPAPQVRVSTSPSIITALAKPLNLDAVVIALQNQLGIDHLQVSGAVLAESSTGKPDATTPVRPLTPGTKLDMVVVVARPHQTPVQTVLEQPDGDATTLVKRGAAWAMEQVSPYRVILAHFLDGIQGDAAELSRASAAANRFLQRPWDATMASNLALTHNVLALIALLDNRIADADQQLTLAETIPDLLPEARSEIALNHSFIALTQGRPDRAAALLAESRAAAAHLDLPGFAANLDIQEGLIAWGEGNIANAEAKFRAVIAMVPDSETAHHYLGQLLSLKGEARGAAAEEQTEVVSHSFETRTQGLAVALFWTDPAKGGVVRRP